MKVALRSLTIVVMPFLILWVFLIDVWQSGLKNALWNIGWNTVDWGYWIYTGTERWP